MTFTKRVLGPALVVGGTLLSLIAVCAIAGGWGTSTAVAAAAPVPNSTPAASAASSASATFPSSTAPSSAGPLSTGTGESAEAFVTAFSTALSTGDAKFLLNRLNPAVIERYGSQTCARYLRTFPRTTLAFVKAHAPQTYAWVTDGQSIDVPNTVTVDVDYTRDGSTSQQSVHIAEVDGRFTWFADCGSPAS